ncbi:hypothetical protein L484_028094 [Morus notabilis]|uniref:Uncharacterized protein n=1 Tax=Morus notabilis TaxID=981085 RepID=W9SWE3_9ROSA|nr:hypothetical protein L484_028094 [Morus notabilis]
MGLALLSLFQHFSCENHLHHCPSHRPRPAKPLKRLPKLAQATSLLRTPNHEPAIIASLSSLNHGNVVPKPHKRRTYIGP